MQCVLHFDEISLSATLTSNSYGMKEGTFTISDVDNPISKIQICLNNPFATVSTLDFQGKKYEILITGASWEYNRDEYYLQERACTYVCTFISAKTSIQENKIIWNCNRKVCENINELFSDKELEVLATNAENLLEKYNDYKPTMDIPYPSSEPGVGVEADIAAVLVDRKPSAVFGEIELSDPLIVLLLKEAIARNLVIETVENFGTRLNSYKSIIVGEKYVAGQITEIMRQAVHDCDVSDYYYFKLGLLLGHPEEYLISLIDNIKDFGFNRIK